MENPRSNQLQFEKSPYLLQHKNNPIWWMSWGDEAFRLARAENKPIFLSVGYSTCHWCHVMAHESFEDSEVAQVLNDGFICIKVDREELPDVDHVYMNALQVMTGGGGWPMSVWLTNEGKPFFTGTYFPKLRFLQLLRRVTELWSQDKDKLLEDGERLTHVLHQVGASEESEVSEAEQEDFLRAYTAHFQEHFDERNGGFGGAPKFPQTMNLMVMMRLDHNNGTRVAQEMVTKTLTQMVRGGVYDQLMGGFHRYSVDEEWLVPHFEKMLYDQAMLAVTLIEAHQLYTAPELARAARETLDYVLREMTHADGGFFAAQDADSLNPQAEHNEEGYFCTFSHAELCVSLNSEELTCLEKIYGVSAAGNFEGRNILHLQEGSDGTAQTDAVVASALNKLRRLRAAKPQPHLDDKIICAWNGWMCWSLVKAGLALAEPKYIQAATRAMNFMSENLWREGLLHRFWRAGEAKGRGTAEDYTSLIHACLELYQADFNPRWVEWSMALQKTLNARFWDVESGIYFANDGANTLLPMRPRDEYDGVSPCSNSMAVYNLNRLYLLTGEAKFRHHAERIGRLLFQTLKTRPSSLPFLALGMEFHLAGAQVAVLNGGGWVGEYYQDRSRQFQPHLLWARADTGWQVTVGKTSEQPSVFICEEGQCLAPAVSRDQLRS